MTLILAGYEYKKTEDIFDILGGEKTPQCMEISGIFVASDSAITSGSGKKTILNGFKKVYEVEARLWKPDFTPGEEFSGYRQVFKTSKGFIAFAGSTLTAQHILNGVYNHLENLRISFSRESIDGKLNYTVLRDCENNPLYSKNVTRWGRDTFTDGDFRDLLTGEAISICVEHSINAALKSAAKYKLDINEFNSMRTDIISGFFCPVLKRYELYVYRMESKKDLNGQLVPYTQKVLIPNNEVVVLGMRQTFEQRAQNIFSSALANCKSPSQELYKFLKCAIQEVKNMNSNEIDKPTSLKILNDVKLRRAMLDL